jgi:hypothetical protein
MPSLWEVGIELILEIFLFPFCFEGGGLMLLYFQVYFAEKVTALDKDWHKMCFKVVILL